MLEIRSGGIVSTGMIIMLGGVLTFHDDPWEHHISTVPFHTRQFLLGQDFLETSEGRVGKITLYQQPVDS